MIVGLLRGGRPRSGSQPEEETTMTCKVYRKRGPTWAFECRDDFVLDLIPDHTHCADPRRVWSAVGKLRGGVCGAAEGVCR
jgi:hypothetical protein